MKQLEADWLKAPATQHVFDLLVSYPTYVVGGCVRNQLLGEPIKDIDFATAARPETVMELAETAGLRVVPTGIDHGTVTLVIEDKPHEVTTFRRDVETDGRRAVVAYSDGIEDDARRRDFTINAIYADRHGVLRDPVNGLPDIAARRIRFIEDANQRVREDYLRSLRFFRFVAWYGDPEVGLDPDALDAIAGNLTGLETLSKERVGSEMLRLLSAPDPAPALASMRATGVLPVVLPGSDDTAIAPLIELERTMVVPPDAIRRLAVLGGDASGLRLSRADSAKLELLRDNVGAAPATMGYRHGLDTGRDILLVSDALLGRPGSAKACSEVRKGAAAEFPVKAADLMPGLEGKALGDKLRALELDWIESDFTLSREALLSKG
jgi:poly(A) polymerase